VNEMEAQMLHFIQLVLEDGNGISQDAYSAFIDLAESDQVPLALRAKLIAIRNKVDATDERFYLPDDDDDEGSS